MSYVYRIAADLVVVAHMAYALAVVLGLPAIWLGLALRHQWVRSFRLRCGHLAMILVVVAEAWLGITCPLTVWEQWLRELAGEATYRGAFLANVVHDLLFYDVTPQILAGAYTIFGLLVVGARSHWLLQIGQGDQFNRIAIENRNL